MRPLTIRQREALDRLLATKFPRADFRDGLGLDRILIALCIAVPVFALAVIEWGGR